MPTVAACMIVKDEAAVIRRCLDSVRGLVDYVLVEDTGSSDGTQEIIRDWLALHGVPGEVFDAPWQDFAHNRTLGLVRLRDVAADYAIVLDADDVLVCADPAALKASLTADLYDVEMHLGGVTYWRPQIFRNSLEFCYRGVLHEYLELPAADLSRETLRGAHIDAGTSGHRSADPDKYRNDALLLQGALEAETNPFLRSRYMFYLAQSWRDCGQQTLALHAYQHRAELGFWNEEVFYSLFQVARMREALRHAPTEVVAAYLRAWEAVPHRVEPLYYAARYCRSAGLAHHGAVLAQRGQGIKLPATGLFLEPWIYDHGLRNELGACVRAMSIAKVFRGCPACGHGGVVPTRPDLQPHPYVACGECGLLYQPRMPAKVYEASHEVSGDQMSLGDQMVNIDLAKALYVNHLAGSHIGEPMRHFDIGSKYPFFGHCLQIMGQAHGRPLTSYGIDGIAEAREFGEKLGVTMAVGDFEEISIEHDTLADGVPSGGYHCVTMIHSLEHCYDPLAALHKAYRMMAPGGVLFIRSPDSAAPGIERDFTAGHYEIHPTVWCESAMRAALDRLPGMFHLQETYAVGHSRDYILRVWPSEPCIINILRPGAIGDVIATGAAVAGLMRIGVWINYYTKCHEAAAMLGGVDQIYDASKWDTRLPGTDLALTGYPVAAGYPEQPMLKHLTEYFCEEAGVPARLPIIHYKESYPPGCLRWITIHAKTGWSHYKEWQQSRWQLIIARLRRHYPDIGVVQIGAPDDPLLLGVTSDMRGETTLGHAAWLIQHSLFHMGVDSFSNHIAGALRHPAIILFGSTSPTGSGYSTAVNLWAGLPCSPCYREDPAISAHPRGPCVNPPGQDYMIPQHACMAEITVDRVWDEVEAMMERINAQGDQGCEGRARAYG